MDLGVSYISTHLPGHIDLDMKHLAEIGCTEVLFALQENHFRTLTGGVRFGAELARKHGLRPYVVVWGFANTFGGGRMSNFMLENQNLWRIHQNTKLIPKACLNNPEVVEKFELLTRTCNEHGYLGMFVDDPTPQDCFCKHCQQRFEERFNLKLIDSIGSAEYQQFRIETVSFYTREISRSVKTVNPELRTITCVMPHDRKCWEAVAKIDDLDVFGTDSYWLLSRGKMSLEQAVSDAKAIRELCQKVKKQSQIWLNCWKIPAGLEEQIYIGGKQLAAVGCDSLYTWSFRGGLGTNEECENPEKAWTALEKLYRELSGV